MEIVSMEMKARGVFVSRCLAFTGAEFELLEVPITPSYKAVYDGACRLWADLRGLLEAQGFKEWRRFWGAHQRCFRYLCIGAKIDECVRLSHEGRQRGMAVVRAMQPYIKSLWMI
eukprot:SAG31_NODE_11631_length_1011_cov_1.368421_1_plen_115_part_00